MKVHGKTKISITQMNKSFTRSAADAFRQGDYQTALDLYTKLGKLLGEKNFRANISLCRAKLQRIAGRNFSRLPQRDIKVACIMDDFTFHSFEPECLLLQLTPQNIIEELAQFKPDLFFIESAWRGKDDLWNRKIGTLSYELKAALEWCNDNNVPTVFWNKEDPVHFETFLTTAQRFDYVFTTDIDCIARYKAALGHDRVYLLPFACQPRIHNPIEIYQRKDAFCFAGAYYVRYPDRIRDLKNYVAEFPKFKPLEIYDRNFGKDDINYQFPPEYQPYIVGSLPFTEINKAYKGYRYSINLNSIKQSQSMFARRVFELLGSNTITVSNFSRGARLLFGDLVIVSDSGKEVVDRLQKLDEEAEQKLRLAALRKVMLEHTYGQRLAYVAKKTLGVSLVDDLPFIVVLGLANSQDEYQILLNSYMAQRYAKKRLVLVLKDGLTIEPQELPAADLRVKLLSAKQAAELFLGDFVDAGEWLATMAVDDHYGANYLSDLALATRYSNAQVVGKAGHYRWADDALTLHAADRVYRPVDGLPIRASITGPSVVPREQALRSLLEGTCSAEWSSPGLAVDPFNYCFNGGLDGDQGVVCRRVDDAVLDIGLPIDELLRSAESIGPAALDETVLPRWGAVKLQHLLGNTNHPQVGFEVDNDDLVVTSSLDDKRHEYFYAREVLPIKALPTGRVLDTHLNTSPGLDIMYVLLFLDEKKQKLGHVIQTANRNHASTLPEGAAFVRFGWRVRGSGKCRISCLLWGHRRLESAKLLGRSETLLLTNHYPSYDDLYRNGFVHSRVKAYLERGVSVDVFRLRTEMSTSYHEFQNVDVVTGAQPALRRLLDSGRYRRVLVHFLSPEMWEVLQDYPDLPKIVWVHGAEIQPWYRRDYNYRNDQERAKAIRESELRMSFWRGILKPIASNLKLIFVSRYFAEEVFEDIGFRLPDDRYSIIHNPIMTDIFVYEKKLPEKRKRVLSIRPYASQKYANDLSVQAIIKLSEYPFFHDLEFRMIGDGQLFDEILEPLRKFPNVKIERRFLTQTEIAALHKEYGIFLTPTRMDAQGVSRDEAMASGLVPITNKVAAIPEFVDVDCGILADPEDYVGLANGIVALYEQPKLFERLSETASSRVRSQSAASMVIVAELALFESTGSR